MENKSGVIQNKNLESFLEHFSPVQKGRPVRVESVQKTPTAYEVVLDNTTSITSTDGLRRLLGVESIRVKTIPPHKVKLYISRLPKDFSYGIGDALEYIRNKKEWFIGLSENGPEYIDPKDIVHGIVYGGSGFGKSTFFKLLLQQNLINFPEHGNIIIDLKGNDFKNFEDVPGVMAVARDSASSYDYMQALVIEYLLRIHYFNYSFVHAPSNITEYHQLREKHKAYHLPEFKRIYVWIDEAQTLFDEVAISPSYMGTQLLLQKARSAGIHLMFATNQNIAMSSMLNQVNFRLFFSNPATTIGSSSHNHVGIASALQEMGQYKGKLIYDLGNGLSSPIHAPDVSSLQALYLRDRLGIAPREPVKFTPIHLPMSLIWNHQLVREAKHGASLEQLLKSGKEIPPDKEKTFGLFDFYRQGDEDAKN